MDAQSLSDSVCPFCPFSDLDSTFVAVHVQYCHPENGSQVESEVSSQERLRAGLADQSSAFSGHEDVHREEAAILRRVEEMIVSNESTILEHETFYQSQIQSERSRDKAQQHHFSPGADQTGPSLRTTQSKIANGGMKRLGRAELGPYAHEKRMPSWLLRMLDKGNTTTMPNRMTQDGKLSRHIIIENETPNVIPALAQLCRQDNSVQRAFFCSAHVHQISKMPREGGFCGYRNIQMLVSYLQECRGPGNAHFPGTLPTILQLQNMIECAWDLGYNSVGRTETGGIKGTRKYIGTSEAQALFLSLGIQCEAGSIGKTKYLPAHSALLSQVAAYFRSACPLDKTEKVTLTNLPPVYFQHHGHSMTIVGFEIRDQGNANILVFDPTFKTPSVIKLATTTKITTSDPARILKGYRKGVNYLQKYQVFELLKLLPPGIPPEK